MSWVNSYWTCDAAVNGGYPYITDAGLADVYDSTGGASVWKFSVGVLSGYPTCAPTASAYDPSGSATVWGLRPDVLMGYPHILAVFPPDPPAPGMVPRLVSFMLQGLSAGFRQADDAQGLSAPETLPGTFREPPCMTFRFQSEGVIP